VGIADLLLKGHFPLLGYGTVRLGIPPAWNCDFISGKRWPEIDATLIQAVCHDGSDVKVPWELSRLQFLPVLAKAHLLTNEQCYRDCAKALLSNWIDQNPVGMGVNWTIAMEVALRAISICLLLDLLWPMRQDEQAWLRKVTHSLWQHSLYIEAYPEFSHLGRSNHYLSNIVGLLCLATFLEGPQAKGRRRYYQELVEQEIFEQVYEDGGDYEASTGYHVLVTQMFTTALLLTKAGGAVPDGAFVERLRQMYCFPARLTDRMGRLPHVGDCDDGCVELLMDDLQQMLEVPVPQRHSLAISNFLGIGSALFGDYETGAFDDAAWYGLERRERMASAGNLPIRTRDSVALFPRAGVAVARHRNWEVLFFAMPNGCKGKGSHTHNDKLSFVLRVNGEELFGDSGTGVYTRDWTIRNRFRSTAAHNTVLVGGTEQNRISWERDHLFHIGSEAQITPIQSTPTPDGVVLSASHAGYDELKVTHRRRVHLCGDSVLIEDILSGTGSHEFEVNLHISPLWQVEVEQAQGKTVSCRFDGPSPVSMVLSAPVHMELEVHSAPISRTYGSSFDALCMRVRGRCSMPVTLVTHLACNARRKSAGSVEPSQTAVAIAGADQPRPGPLGAAIPYRY